MTDILLFFFNDPATTEIYTLSLHDALPIFQLLHGSGRGSPARGRPPVLLRALGARDRRRSEEHTSELQSPMYLVCRLLLEKKKRKNCPTNPFTSHTYKQCLSTTDFVASRVS